MRSLRRSVVRFNIRCWLRRGTIADNRLNWPALSDFCWRQAAYSVDRHGELLAS
jgi:hypothetical protein